ncbi:CCA tRNA nucleotidyltransferase [Chloroflexota bacterium]
MGFTEADLKNSFSGLIESEVWFLLNKVYKFFAEQGIESYVVGGWVRDVLIGRATADIDLAVAYDALQVAPRVADALGGKYVLLDSEGRVGRVILADKAKSASGVTYQLDFSTFTGSIEQDMARRDFTIDAMAINLDRFGKGITDVSIVDPFNGRDDLRRGIVRAVSETAFASDAARLLRAVRLAAELGFTIDEETRALIQRDSQLISGVASERVREDLLRLLAVPGAGQFIRYLDELGLLIAIFPELAQMKGVKQPQEHFWDVFEHSLQTVLTVDFLLRQGVLEYAGEEALAAVPWPEVLVQHFSQEVSSGSTRGLLLKLAALLHDISKPQAKSIDTTGRMRFLGHARDGAAVVAGMLERLRFSSREIKLVEALVRYHMRPTQMSQAGLPTRRALYRYFRDTGDAGIDILFLSLADHLATRGPNLDLASWREHTQLVGYVVGKRFEQENIVSPPKLVDGYDIINIFGVSPGPKVGELLEVVREAQASGEVATREEALALIEKELGSTDA